MQTQEAIKTEKALWHGLNSGLPQSTLTGAEELALWDKNGANRPYTRISVAKQALLRKRAEAEKSKQD